MLDSTQIWRSIPGFTGYEVSDLGNVRNSVTGNHLVLHSASNGGVFVNLGKSTRLVHKLVMLVFGGEKCGRIVHVNGDRRDNRLSNLCFERSVRVDHCVRGHELVGSNVVVWGGKNRICVACRDGVPAVRRLPDVI